jgi:CubicO group peptidase (beta-lactamase class C family)
MPKLTLPAARFAPCVILLTFLFLPIISPAQTKSSKSEKVNTPDRKPVKGYSEATYSLSGSGQYMSAWLVAGPVPVGTTEGNPQPETQITFFNEEIPPVVVNANKPVPPLELKGKQYAWTLVKTSDDIIDLDKQYSGADFSAAFALAEIRADQEVKTFLGVGSDDGIRIWHNGKLIHDNWIPRGVSKDADLVPLTLQPGSNQILLKVQDMQQGWGFVVRLLNKEAVSDQLITASGTGDMDQINQLLEAGAALEQKNKSGLTALNNARLNGRDEIAQLLLSKGAKESALPAVDALIDGLYNSLDGKPASGIAVLVSKDGQVIYRKGFGYADIDKKELIKPDTKFRIGSITKQFTAAAILKLQEEGKISVTDKLSKFLPDFPRAEEVTIHHLLTHTSGIHSYTDKPDFVGKVTSPMTEEEVIAYFKGDPYDFNPGEKWQYNNSAYFLLGHIIGKVTGKPYGAYLKETFFDPLGMANTGVHSSTLKLKDEARGYTKENGQYKLAANWEMSWAGGAGALYSTVEDLHTWNEALFNGKVLQEKSMESAFTPVVLNNGKKPDNASYGYGWALGEYRGQEIIEHGGGLHGFLSQLARFPEENTTIVLLTNITPPEVNINHRKVSEFLLWEKMEKQASRSLNASVSEDVNQYAGRYDFPNGAVMIITAEDHKHFAQHTGQPKFPSITAGEGEYFWKVVEAKIKFVKNGNGEVEYGDFEQNGNKLKVAKLKDETIVAIDKALYKLYSGKYDFGNNMTIAITTENDRLYAQATNQPRFEILPISEEEFTVRELNAKFRFVKEPDGKVSKFILDMAGQKKEVVRVVE